MLYGAYKLLMFAFTALIMPNIYKESRVYYTDKYTG